MRIFIITMEDPLYTLPFIKDIIQARKNDIVGVAVSKGGRLKIGKKRSKIVYLLSLLLVMGLPYYVKNVFKVLKFKIRKKLSFLPFVGNPGLKQFCVKQGIPVIEIQSPNNRNFLNHLKSLEPDLVISQAQYILKAELLSIPKLGVLNRHNALLPKNRGRLTPFWVLYKKEKETGVSIHFVNEGMDAGPIIVQKRFDVLPDDTFATIVEKNYKIASSAMLEAIQKIERGNFQLLQNPDSEATVNSVPTLRQAWRYRLQRIRGKS